MRDHGVHSHKKGESPQGFHLRVPKLVFILSRNQCGFLAIHFAPVSTIFEGKDVNRYLHAYTSEKSLCRGFPGPKNS